LIVAAHTSLAVVIEVSNSASSARRISAGSAGGRLADMLSHQFPPEFGREKAAAAIEDRFCDRGWMTIGP
jgi:hypothetical protein